MSDFNSIIAISQNCQTPVFALTKEQIQQEDKHYGKVLESTLKSQNTFKDTFSNLADTIINLTSNNV
ncbi:MAG: hypothetical protein F6K22_21990 [Okeania sp. SIO2F4]|uniref:hypothetical protein n=1 Tax=Okeania sp. SIO2F4 TaxID=2607790 RepID=UPI00142AEC26|nr:hypothetical protein [Okeania sp. SIO2F4]NES05255.1 hypothetical protein [Okeania sp. SIO2F4]